jgi:Protein of unknown function (DUF3305)
MHVRAFLKRLTMAIPSVAVAVIMERRSLANRWQTEQWAPIGVVPDTGDSASTRLPYEDSTKVQWLHPGFAIELHRDEAEGYYLNASSEEPYAFVMWRMENDIAVPKVVTVSYNEASRMMDGGEQVDGVPLSADLVAWLRDFVQQHYRPEPKRRIRPPSFKGARRD